MKTDTSLFNILSVTNQDQEQYAKLLRHYGYSELGPMPFEAKFLLYGNEIIQDTLCVGDNLPDRHSAQESTEILQQIFRDYPVTNLWDIAFNLRLFDYAEGHCWTSMADLRQSVTEKAIQDPFYLPLVSESRGIILWRHQAQNILGLFFENRHVISHYIRELGQKRIPSRERLNQITMPTGEELGNFLCAHSFLNGIFPLPNLQVASQLWQIANGMPYVSFDLDKIMQNGRVI